VSLARHAPHHGFPRDVEHAASVRGAESLDYQVTIEDPKVFTRPWKIQMPLYRRQDKGAQLLEFRCVEFVEELMYGHLRKKTGDEKPFSAARLRWP